MLRNLLDSVMGYKLKKKTFLNNKCKDELPVRTIQKVRGILLDLGVFTIEEIWKSSSGKFYSVLLNAPDSNIRANGKGTTPEYALASAYGEFMERLQNQVLSHFDYDFEESVEQYLGFYHSPDEKMVRISDLREAIPRNLNSVYKPLDFIPKNSKEYLIDISNEIPGNNGKNLLSVPYYSVNHNKLVYLPVTFLKYYYGSNGMCAGNTPEEAIVQGICEILERYVNKKILLENIIPPIIPKDYLKKFKTQYAMIKRIESTGMYKVLIKDCSLGRKFPVVALILINTKTNSYFVKIGSHPFFEIALERCLIELLQGRDISRFHGLSQFKYFSNLEKRKINTKNNIESIFVQGSGCYPNSFFKEGYSYSLDGFSHGVFISNKEILKYLTDFIKTFSFDILVRDVSFLGFPSYFIVVPGMSEIFWYNRKEYKNIGMKRRVRKIIRELAKCNNNELRMVIDFMDNEGVSNSKTLADLTGLPVKESFPWEKIKYNIFLSSAHYRLDNIGKAYEYINKYVEYFGSVSKEDGQGLSYYRCVRDYFSILLETKDKKVACKFLAPIYGKARVEDVLRDLKNRQNVFNYYEKLSCWNCKQCNLKEHCHYEGIKQLHMKLKREMKKNYIDQMNLRDVFKF